MEYNSKDKLRMLLVEPHKLPKVVEVKKDLSAYRKILNCNCIDMPHFFDDVDIICDDEGLIKQKPFNRSIKNDEQLQGIFGTFLIAGFNYRNGETTSLSDDLINKYQKIFYMPENLLNLNGKVLAVPDYDAFNHETKLRMNKRNNLAKNKHS